MLLGAADCGVISILDELSVAMLIDLMNYKSRLTNGDTKNVVGEPKRLSEIIKGGKI